MPRDLLIIAISLFIWGVGEGMFIYFQPLYLQKWGANPLEIGAILGTMGVAMAISQAPAGYLADRVGSRPVMWGSWALGSLAALVMAQAGSLSGFVIGMLMYGLTSFVVAPMNSYITSVRGSWSVERALAVVSAMFHLGAVAGPIIGGIIGEAFGFQTIYRIASGIFIISTAIILAARKPPVEQASEFHAGRPHLLGNPRFIGLLALIFLTMFALYMPQPLTPNYLEDVQNFKLGRIGLLGATGSLGNALILLTFSHLNAQTGFLVGQAFMGVFALLMWRSEALPLFFVGYFCIGGYRLCRSMALAYARSLVRANEVGLAFGLVETSNAIATILAPLAAGLLYSRDPHWMYSAGLAIIAAALLINMFLLPKSPKPSLADERPKPDPAE